MTATILYNSFLYLTGYVLLRLITPGSLFFKHLTAFITGMAFFVTSGIILLIFRIPISIISISVIYVVIFSLGLWAQKHELKTIALDFRRELVYLGFFFGLFLMVNVVVINFNPSKIVWDSLEYIGVGTNIFRTGTFPIDDLFKWQSYLEGRMAFLPLLYAGSLLFGVEVYLTAFPITAFYLVGIFLYLFIHSGTVLKCSKLLIFISGISGTITLISTPAFWFNAFFVNQHLFVASYFTVALACIFLYSNTQERTWLLLGGAFLGVCTLIRNEMIVFSVIPISLLLGTAHLNKKDYGTFILSFLTIALPWSLFRLYHLGFQQPLHNWGLLQVILIFAVLLSYVTIYYERLREKFAPLIPRIVLSGALLATLGTLYFSQQLGAESAKVLLLITIGSGKVAHGYTWGTIWIALCAITILDLFFVKARSTHFWMYAVAIFFLLRLNLYGLPLFPKTYEVGSMYNSGSRILTHILPSGVFYMSLFLLHVLSNGSKHINFSNQVRSKTHLYNHITFDDRKR